MRFLLETPPLFIFFVPARFNNLVMSLNTCQYVHLYRNETNNVHLHVRIFNVYIFNVAPYSSMSVPLQPDFFECRDFPASL